MSVRFGDDIARMLRLFKGTRVRFFGITIGRVGIGLIRWEPTDAAR